MSSVDLHKASVISPVFATPLPRHNFDTFGEMMTTKRGRRGRGQPLAGVGSWVTSQEAAVGQEVRHEPLGVDGRSSWLSDA